MRVVVEPKVRQALAEGRPVVAMESTNYSTLGLPAPANAEALARCQAAVRRGGAVPAVTVVIDGRWRGGVAGDEQEPLLSGTRKVAERDLPVAAAQGWDVASPRCRPLSPWPTSPASRCSRPGASAGCTGARR